MLAYVNSTLNATEKRVAPWSKYVNENIPVKVDLELVRYILDCIYKITTSYELFKLDKEYIKGIIFNDYIPALKTVSKMFSNSTHRFFGAWLNIACILYSKLDVRNINKLYLEEIPISSTRDYICWVCKFSTLCNNDSILFPSKAEGHYDLYVVFNRWIRRVKNPKGFPSRFKAIRASGMHPFTIANLLTKFGIKSFSIYPELKDMYGNVTNEIQYLTDEDMYLDIFFNRKLENVLKDIWKIIHPDMSLLAAKIYGSAFYYSRRIINKAKNEELLVVDKNGFSLAMCWIIKGYYSDSDVLLPPKKLRNAHFKIFGKDNKYLDILCAKCGVTPPGVVFMKKVKVKDAKYHENRCPICFEELSDDDMCMELYCGHMVCLECSKSISHKCMYRCEYVIQEDIKNDDIISHALEILKQKPELTLEEPFV